MFRYSFEINPAVIKVASGKEPFIFSVVTYRITEILPKLAF